MQLASIRIGLRKYFLAFIITLIVLFQFYGMLMLRRQQKINIRNIAADKNIALQVVEGDASLEKRVDALEKAVKASPATSPFYDAGSP